MTSSDETTLDPNVAERLGTRVGRSVHGGVEGTGRRIAIVAGRFNGGVTARLLEGALDALEESGVARSDVSLAWVPGAFEIPFAAREFARAGADAVVALGAVIRGETGHYDFVAGQCARGLQDVQLATGVPVIFGVLTTDTVAQALERARDDETNKGREAALTALEMAGLVRQVRGVSSRG